MNNRESVLKFIVYPLPLWWVMGLEQIFIYLFGVYCLLVFLKDKNKRMKDHEILLLLFLLSTFMSAFFVYQPSRLLEIFRSTIAFSVLIFGSRYIGMIISENGKQNILKYVYVIFMWSIASALAGYFLPEFTLTAPIEIFIPNALKDYSLVTDLYEKRLGATYYSIFGAFWRPNGFYSYSTALAVTMAVLIPMIHLYKQYTQSKYFIAISIWLGIIVLFLTTTRSAIIAIIAVYIFYGLFIYTEYRKYIVLTGLLLIMLLPLLVDIQFLFQSLMEIRGSGSISFRSSLYEQTILLFYQRPLFGWGAQIPHEEFYAALGSHSTYINLLFCYGIIGFTIFTLATLRCFINLSWTVKNNLLLIGSWLGFSLVCVTQVFHVDFITLFVLSHLFALSAYKDLRLKEVPVENNTPVHS